MKKRALVLVDIQNDYFEGGKMPLYKSEEAAQNAALLLRYFRKNNLDIVHIQHLNAKSGSFFIEGTNGVEIHSSVKPLDEEIIVQKRFPNSFKETGLLERLRELQVEQLIVCGIMTHICIDATVRAAKDLDFEVTLLEDACTTKDLCYKDSVISALDVHYSYVASLSGIYAEVLSTKDFLKIEDIKKNSL